ncbi:MAG: hypothetical protein NC393_03065 [Clostridium sp.]|nr:hypothetical protein [Clostridium sp.]MCM1207869.1 hypothetical protein [Ruminococcus sp.]
MIFRKKLIAAVIVVVMLLSNNIISYGADPAISNYSYASLNGYNYKYWSVLYVKDGKATAGTSISSRDGRSIPTGYMGVQARIFKDGSLNRYTDWKYNTTATTNCYVMTLALATNSGSVYYSQGNVRIYNGSGETTYVCNASPRLHGSAYSLTTNVDEIITRNSKGEIYGQEPLLEAYGIHPDLIAAIGDNEIHGYVYAEDLEGFVPNTPEEAIAYQNSHRGISRIINVYDCEGEIVLDTFTIDNSDVDENIYFE